MFRFSYYSDNKDKQPRFIIGTPANFERLGEMTDDEGRKWDVASYFGPSFTQCGYPVLCACPIGNLHPYYTDTSSYRDYGLVMQTWEGRIMVPDRETAVEVILQIRAADQKKAAA